MSKSRAKIGRREFLRKTGQGVGVAGVGVMAARTAEAHKRVEPVDPRTPKVGRLLTASDTIGIGVIGVGGRGTVLMSDLLERQRGGQKLAVRCVSDVYERRKKDAQDLAENVAGATIDAYTDYAELLARDDVDGVVIATPDHWHAKNSIEALQAGKDVYCEKPMTYTIEEAVDVRNAVYVTGRVYQCGSQHCSEDRWWQVRRFIKEGGIGKVLWAQADRSRNSAGGPYDRGGEWNWTIDEDATDDPSAGEAYIDWKRWLGPARKRPFSKPRFFQFRKFWDYSGGVATDLLYHWLAPLTIALDARPPEQATGAGGIFIQHDDREVPDTFMMTLDYPDDYTIILTSSMANRQGNPVVIRGHRATIWEHEDDAVRITAEEEFKEWFKKRYGAEEIILEPKARLEHMENWLEAIRTRRDAHCNAETAYRAMAGVRMGIDSYRKEKVIFYDGAKERYTLRHPRPHRDSKHPAVES